MKVCKLTLLILFSFLSSFSQELNKDVVSFGNPPPVFIDSPRKNHGLRIVFYNTENLFDTFKDSVKNDGEFTPDGKKKWDTYKYHDKLLKISKTLINMGGFEPPEIIGLCEIENRQVLEDLIKKTPLNSFPYKIIHYESPDLRGIDVGLLYLPEKFTPVFQEPIPIIFQNNTRKHTRDILYVKGIALNTDTLHIFINHWPSRSGGQMKSDPDRIFVATILENKVDSIQKISPRSKIIITGDLNDEPTNFSIDKVLKAGGEQAGTGNTGLYNCMYPKTLKGEGIIYYKDKSSKWWYAFDQFIISGALLHSKKGLKMADYGAQIFNAKYLLNYNTPDEPKPFRTFRGPLYMNGYSDHLPVFLDLNLQ